MQNVQPDWINKTLYPFHSKWITIQGNEIHYIDEGEGPVILFVHGTPEWSFGYRDLVKPLSAFFRCIAPDLLGFGLSDKPAHGDYTCQAHATRLEDFISALNLKNITIVSNDFGGSISMSYAIRFPERVSAIILFNTWMRSLKNDKHFSRPARIMNNALGKFLYLHLNFPVNVIMPAAFGNKKLLTKEIHLHYKKALPGGKRHAAYTFAREILHASDWWDELWKNAEVLRSKPVLIFWGMKDKFIPSSELEKWKSKLPEARVIIFNDAGHFVQEEKPEAMVEAILGFLKSDPVGGN